LAKEWRAEGEKMLQPPRPVEVRDLFAEDRRALLALLGDLTDAQWAAPTVCAGWTVKDVALHLLGGDLGNLSRRRDGFLGTRPAPGEPVVAFVNRVNDEWLRAARRLSCQVVVELLAALGPPLFDHFATLDGLALGGPVSWAGPAPAPVWLDLAREYTERWHHQQHIRDAVGRPGETERRFLDPVLATFVHALPVTYRDVVAPAGTAVHLQIAGAAAGDWTVVRDADGWRLFEGEPEGTPAARVCLADGLAWRLFTRGVAPADARSQAQVTGDVPLGERLLYTVAIIA
jgi:uncharacterized protein (TIGR03083 family)